MNGIMPRWIALLAVLLATGISGALLSGCAGTAVDQNDPGALMREAEEDIKSDHYQIALDKLRSIKNKFPYSKYSLEAQLRIADVYFMQEAYPEAAAAYESFADLHPKHEKVAYALYRVGKSYFNDVPDPIARDLTSAQRSLDAYSDFLRRFSTSAEADEARKDVTQLRKLLAEKEFYIAEFYLKRSSYRAAKPRLEKVITMYPETEAAKEAQKKLAGIEENVRKEIEEENASAGRNAGKK